jgi:hypothetical protein
MSKRASGARCRMLNISLKVTTRPGNGLSQQVTPLRHVKVRRREWKSASNYGIRASAKAGRGTWTILEIRLTCHGNNNLLLQDLPQPFGDQVNEAILALPESQYPQTLSG